MSVEFDKIDDFLGRGDCRSAEDVWNILNEKMRGGDTTYTHTDLKDKRNQIVRRSKELSDDIQRQIDHLLAQSGEIDEFIAEEFLYQLERALLKTDEIVYERTKDAVRQHIQVVKEQSAYDFASKAVKKYWQDAQAKQINDPVIPLAELLPYFTKALEEAKRQLSYYEQNTSYSDAFKDRLRALIEDAESQRDALNRAEKSLTSGALIEDYVTNLDYIRTAPPGLMIQIYDMFGTVTGSEPKDKAYAIYSERALDLARKKLITYMEGGEGRLGIRKLLELGEPRAAQKIYEEYEEKFGKLERQYVPDIGRLEEHQDLYRFKADIDVALRQLDAVETEAQKIAELADKADTRDVLVGLWNQHQANIKNYPLAEHSSVAVRDTRDLLRRRILMYLYAVADQIDVAVNAADLTQGRKLISDNRTLLELPILKDEEIITRINNYGAEMNDIEEKLNALYTTLDDLSHDTPDNLGNKQKLINKPLEILRELFQKEDATLHRDYVLELENGLRRSIDVLVITKNQLYAFEIKSFAEPIDYSNSYMMIDSLVNQEFINYHESLYYFVIYYDIVKSQYLDFNRQQPSDKLFVTVDDVGGINLLFSSDFNNIHMLKSKIGQTQPTDLTQLSFLSWNRQIKKQHSVFISYRRDDSAWATGRIADYLRTIYQDEEIFLDTWSIDLGDNFDEIITKRIKASNILLVVIGKKWLNISDPVSGIRRLDMANDYVKKEIVTAIQNKLIIIPVLIDDTGMPWTEYLPSKIKSLAKHNAARVRADQFMNDMKPLIDKLDSEKVKRKP